MKRLSAIALTALIGAGAISAQSKGNTAYMVSNAHLDTQWNWDVQATIKNHIPNTINQNLMLIREFPDYIFNFEGGIKYAWMKEYYPREYELVKEQIKNGRWHISGSSWDANDVNVPSVESQIRNILYGQQFYRDEFGVESTDIFLPDCFGFGYTLPTIASHCGLIGFSSQKLGWRNNAFYPGGLKTPFNLGIWRGVDGSEIMMAHGFSYTARFNNEDLSRNVDVLARTNEAISPNHTVMHYFGTGDVGGSPTYASVLSVEKGLRGDGPVKIISCASDQVFKDYLPFSSHPELPVHDGELLMDLHGTGCYTSQAAMKLYNRQNELLGDAAERAATVAAMIGAAQYPAEPLNEGWKRMLWHQFHDDLTGTSIPRAYEFSWNDELLTLKQFADELTDAANAVSTRMATDVKGTPLLVFNPLTYQASDVIEAQIPANARPASVKVIDYNGKPVAAQVTGFADGKATVAFEATMEPCAFAVYDVRLSGKAAAKHEQATDQLENSRYKVKFDRDGDISSIYDKKAGKELVADGKKIRLALFTVNKSYNWPAWEILKETLDSEPVAVASEAEIKLVENGPLRSTAKISRKRDGSTFVQYVTLYEGDLADRIDFRNEIDWTLTDALLKAEFPLSVANEKATYDLGVGTIGRGNNVPTAHEVYSREWTDLTDASGSYGVTVLNDSKYGWDKPADNTIRLTLLHTPSTKTGYVYQNRQDMGHHEFTYSLVGHEGALDRAVSTRQGEQLNQRFKSFIPAKHKGDLGRSFSAVEASSPNITVKALKKALVSDEYVVRVYNTDGKGASRAAVKFPLPIVAASQADGTEKTIGEANFSGNELYVDVKPNSIATYKVRFDMPQINEPAQQQLPLAFNKKCMSFNEMRSNGNFADGYSYAAELIPDTITSGRVRFAMERHDELNGMECHGDTIAVPAGFNCVSLLMAAASEQDDVNSTVTSGKKTHPIYVPSYTGFIGQWGHDGHTTGYLKDAKVALASTHRHSPEADEPYEFTYLYKIDIPVEKGSNSIILPDDSRLVVFAATAHNVPANPVAASSLFLTANLPSDQAKTEGSTAKASLLSGAKIIGCSGYVNDREKPEFLIDGNPDTKWCDTSTLPNYVDFDLAKPTKISGWSMLNAANESVGYVTSTCFLQGRNSLDDEWTTIDCVTGNRRNTVSRQIGEPQTFRYLRLLVAQPTQMADLNGTRIYDLQVY